MGLRTIDLDAVHRATHETALWRVHRVESADQAIAAAAAYNARFGGEYILGAPRPADGRNHAGLELDAGGGVIAARSAGPGLPWTPEPEAAAATLSPAGLRALRREIRWGVFQGAALAFVAIDVVLGLFALLYLATRNGPPAW